MPGPTIAPNGIIENGREKKITGKRSGTKDGPRDDQSVIPLEDLVPRKDPKGGRAGSGKAVFGGGKPFISGIDGEDREAKKGRREQ